MIRRVEQREAVDGFLIPLIRAELGKPDRMALETRDWGLNFPPYYVISTWLEHKTHGTLPEAGAYNDQDPQLVMEDWSALNRRYNELKQLLMDYKDHDYELPEIDAPDWIEGLID